MDITIMWHNSSDVSDSSKGRCKRDGVGFQRNESEPFIIYTNVSLFRSFDKPLPDKSSL